MSEPIPSVPSATRPAEHTLRGAADRVVHVRARVVRDGRVRLGDDGRLALVEVHAVREQRPLVERARAAQPLDDAHAGAGDAVALVDPVLRRVDVETDPELRCGAGACGERLVAERERCMRADEPARQRRPLVAHPREEAPVLRDAGGRALRPVAVGRLVAEHRAEPERPQRVGDHVERAVDRVRRRMVVDERRRSREQRLHPADERRGAHGLLVERAVEPPPDPLEDLEEVPRRLERVRHPARERRVEVRVRADVPGDDDAARAVAARVAGARGRARCGRRRRRGRRARRGAGRAR